MIARRLASLERIGRTPPTPRNTVDARAELAARIDRLAERGGDADAQADPDEVTRRLRDLLERRP